MATTLFPQTLLDDPSDGRGGVPRPSRPTKPVGPFAGVALERGIDRVLTYTVPPEFSQAIRVGQRVRVPLGRGNSAAFGVVVSVADDAPAGLKPTTRLKPVKAIADERVLVDGPLLELARWIARYYVCPLGTVLDSVIPSAVKKRIGMGYSRMVRLAMGRDEVQELLESTKAPKRRAVLARLLQLAPGEAVEINRLAGEAGVKSPTVGKLAKLHVITVRSEPDLDRTAAAGLTVPDATTAESGGHELNAEQRAAFDDAASRVGGGFSVNLLHGVTGSGKTEVYLRLIGEVVKLKKQAVVLVPEIALTPQTVRRFTARFPRVAVLHSGLSASARHRYWQQIARGGADVVVGARSAVFAPVPDLGMIVIDEEHESSYKQDQAPRYHARDVAIKRGQLQGVPVVLGSATPSLEMWKRVGRGQGAGGSEEKGSGGGSAAAPSALPPATSHPPPSPYHLLSLPNRVRGLAMPDIELIDMKEVARLRRGVHLLSPRLEALLTKTVEAGHQAILLLNRRGYANFVYCNSCQDPVGCKYCDATMTYHRSAGVEARGASNAEGVHTGQLHCHYCLAVNPLPERCPTCKHKLSLFGLGTQRVEEELARKFPGVTFARVDSDTMRGGRDYETTLARFARGEIQVMLGTQMIAKGLDYPNVTLVGVVNGDTALSLPDFRAAERTFQLITQVAGRAGRGDAAGKVIVQTFLPDDPAIQAALRQDFPAFAARELVDRKDVGLPPFGRMVRVVMRDQDADALHEKGEELAARFDEAIARLAGPSVPGGDPVVVMKGPMPCAISRIAGYFRNQVVLSAVTPGPLQRVLAAVREGGHLAASDRVAVDVDPVSLL